MTIFLATAIGGVLGVGFLSLIIGRVFLQDMEPSKKINYSTLGAYIVACFLSGFGRMDGGGLEAFSPFYVEYALSSVLLILIRQGILKVRGK